MGRTAALQPADVVLVRKVVMAAHKQIRQREAAIRRLQQEIADIRQMTSTNTLANGYGVSHMTIRRAL